MQLPFLHVLLLKIEAGHEFFCGISHKSFFGKEQHFQGNYIIIK